MRLLDARFLVELAELLKATGAQLPRRQELPDDAFISLSQLRCMTQSGFGSLRILVVSWPWLQPDHPDPRGDHLSLIAKAMLLPLPRFALHTIDLLPLTPDGAASLAGSRVLHQRLGLPASRGHLRRLRGVSSQALEPWSTVYPPRQ